MTKKIINTNFVVFMYDVQEAIQEGYRLSEDFVPGYYGYHYEAEMVKADDNITLEDVKVLEEAGIITDFRTVLEVTDTVVPEDIKPFEAEIKALDKVVLTEDQQEKLKEAEVVGIVVPVVDGNVSEENVEKAVEAATATTQKRGRKPAAGK